MMSLNYVRLGSVKRNEYKMDEVQDKEDASLPSGTFSHPARKAWVCAVAMGVR